jgi:hypothetical protein
MKRIVTCGLVVAFATLLLGAIGRAGADPDTSSSKESTETLRFDVEFSPFNYLDLGAEGPSVGDETLFNDVLTRNGRNVGKQAGYCKVTALTSDGFEVECLSTVSLPGGQITGQGLTTNAPVKRVAVTGGTGSYSEADGEMRIVEFGNGRGSLTIRIKR